MVYGVLSSSLCSPFLLNVCCVLRYELRKTNAFFSGMLHVTISRFMSQDPLHLLQVFVIAVLAVLPLIPKNLSNRAYRLSFMGTACSSLYSLYSLYGVSRVISRFFSLVIMQCEILLNMNSNFVICRGQGHGICKGCKFIFNQLWQQRISYISSTALHSSLHISVSSVRID